MLCRELQECVGPGTHDFGKYLDPLGDLVCAGAQGLSTYYLYLLTSYNSVFLLEKPISCHSVQSLSRE